MEESISKRSKEGKTSLDSDGLVGLIHHFGFNLRHIGQLSAQIIEITGNNSEKNVIPISKEEREQLLAMKDALIVEGVARTLKNLVRPPFLPRLTLISLNFN